MAGRPVDGGHVQDRRRCPPRAAPAAPSVAEVALDDSRRERAQAIRDRPRPRRAPTPRHPAPAAPPAADRPCSPTPRSARCAERVAPSARPAFSADAARHRLKCNGRARFAVSRPRLRRWIPRFPLTRLPPRPTVSAARRRRHRARGALPGWFAAFGAPSGGRGRAPSPTGGAAMTKQRYYLDTRVLTAFFFAAMPFVAFGSFVVVNMAKTRLRESVGGSLEQRAVQTKLGLEQYLAEQSPTLHLVTLDPDLQRGARRPRPAPFRRRDRAARAGVGGGRRLGSRGHVLGRHGSRHACARSSRCDRRSGSSRWSTAADASPRPPRRAALPRRERLVQAPRGAGRASRSPTSATSSNRAARP